MWVTSALLGLFGFCLIPILGVGYSFTSILFLPVSPAASCGIIHISNSAVSALLTFLVSFFVTKNKWVSVGILVGFAFIGLIFGLFVKENENIKEKSKSMKLSLTEFSVSFVYDENAAGEENVRFVESKSKIGKNYSKLKDDSEYDYHMDFDLSLIHI